MNASAQPRKPLSFKEKQNLKNQQPQPPAKPVESLADRRMGRKQLLGNDDLGSSLEALKTSAQQLDQKQGEPEIILEAIQEEEAADEHFDDQDELLTMPSSSVLEPSQNIS